MDFSVDVINLVKYLKSNHESIISNQIGRSGTSIGANIHEAQYAQGKKDFVSKLEIALKEASETGKWLEMLYKTDYIDQNKYKELATAVVAVFEQAEQAAKDSGKVLSDYLDDIDFWKKHANEVIQAPVHLQELNKTEVLSDTDTQSTTEEERELEVQERRLQLQKEHIRLVKEAQKLKDSYVKLESEQGYDIRSQETSQANVKLLEKLIELRQNENSLKEAGVEFDSHIKEIGGIREYELDEELRLAQAVLQDWIDVNNQIESVKDNQRDLAYYMEEVVRLRSNVRTENWLDDDDKEDTISNLQLAEKQLKDNIEFYQKFGSVVSEVTSEVNQTPLSSEDTSQPIDKAEQEVKEFKEAEKQASEEAQKLAKTIAEEFGVKSKKTIQKLGIEIDDVLAKLREANSTDMSDDEFDFFMSTPPNYHSILDVLAEDAEVARSAIGNTYDSYDKLRAYVSKSSIKNDSSFKSEFGDDWEKKVSNETIAICALLHDLCKIDTFKSDVRNKKVDGNWVQVPYYKRYKFEEWLQLLQGRVYARVQQCFV